MRKFLAYSLLLFSLGGTFFVSGCGSFSPSRIQPPPLTTSERQALLRQEIAIRSFIRGATLDAAGAYAEAILEYQEALLQEPNAAVYYALSRDFARLGKFSRAAETGRESVRLDSLNVTYHENLASVYLSAYQQELAIREYEAVVRLDSNSASAWYNLARLLQPSRPLRALEIYERLLDREGDNLDVLFQCAALYSTLGRHAEAAERFRRMAELDPSDRALQRQLAESYAKSGKIEEAIRILEHMLEVDRNDAETIAALADVYLDQKQYGRATALYEQLLKQGITSPEVKLRVGVGFFAQSENDSSMASRAVILLEEVRDEIPTDWRAHWYLGIIAANRHQDSIASGYFQRVTELAAWNGDAWFYLGSGFFEKNNYAKTLEIMERARKAVPRDHRVYLLLGLAHGRLGDAAKAAAFLEQAYKLNSTDLNTLSSLALQYETMKRYEDCDRIYEEALKVDPSSALILNNYGYSLADRGLQLERALEMARKAVSSDPENPSYLDTIGWIYFKLGRYEEAVGPIERAAAGEASAVVHEHLGDVYAKLGKTEGAIKAWKKALELDPNNAALRAKIERGAL